MNDSAAQATESKSMTAEMGRFTRSKPAWTPHEYQLQAAKFLLNNAVGGLFLDMGLGKSSICLAAIKILLQKGYIKRVLIIAPLRVCYTVWPHEVEKWADFEGLRVKVLHGPGKDAALKEDADIYVMNPDSLEWFVAGGRPQALGADMLIIDESDAFKHTTTKRFKLLRHLLPTFRRRYILTGTPAPNGLMDLFGQIYILDQGATLGKFITHFRNTFFNSTGYGGYTWVLKDGAKEAIYERLDPFVLRMDGKDHLKLPERVDNIVEVQMPEKAWAIYKDFENQFLTMLDSGEAITAPSAAAAGVKMRQVANGAVYRDADFRTEARFKDEEWVTIHDAKLDALEEIVGSQQGKPVLVAYEFEHDASRLRKRFPKSVFMSDARTEDKLNTLIHAWNAGEIAMLCAHPASAGHGLNLQQSCNTLIWFGMTWNLGLVQQFNARVLRQGNTNSHVFIHHIIAKGTIDEAVMKAIRIKDADQAALLDALKAYAKGKVYD